ENLQTNLRPEFRRRIHIMLLADAGESQTQICKKIGCCQIQLFSYYVSPIGFSLIETKIYI
ncbi:MAG: helix-turn-helix domain-containing protein, partial [Cyanobacteria bacterium J06636_27]